MPVSPAVSFEHIWHAIMRVLGNTHPNLLRRNRAIQADMLHLMGRK